MARAIAAVRPREAIVVLRRPPWDTAKTRMWEREKKINCLREEEVEEGRYEGVY